MPFRSYLYLCLVTLFLSCTPRDLSQFTTNQNNPVEQTQNQSLLIYIIDVGQGDATLILGPEKNGHRKSLLIDAGPLDPDAGATILDLFEMENVENLDDLLLTHYDADHMGGMVTAYNSTSLLWDENCEASKYFPSQAIIDLGETDKDTYSVLEYIRCRDTHSSRLEKGHITIGENPSENIGYEIDLNNGYKAKIVAGNGYVLNQEERVPNVDTDNEKSIAVLITGPNDFSFLVTGDLTGRIYGDEDALVETALGNALQSLGIEVDILRAGHHGSANASSPDFIQAIRPEIAIISVGDNSHGHPHCEALESLFLTSKTVLQTEQGVIDPNCLVATDVIIVNGTITIQVDENGRYELIY